MEIEICKVYVKKEGVLNVVGNQTNSPGDVYKIAKEYLKGADRENLVCLCLNTKNKIINISTISIGTLNSTPVSPREVFKVAIASNSASIILIHNHPSGDAQPSRDDIQTTRRLKECGKILGIEVLDHIILGEDSYISLKEKEII